VEEQTDSTFIRNIAIVLAILIVFTISIAFIARDIGFKEDQGNNPGSIAITEERIRPVADVYTGKDGAAAIEQAAATSAPAQAVAFDGSLDGEMIYNSVCAACHATGVAEAPKPGSAAMSQRAEKGLDALMQSALNGLNAMPARGGRVDLSDEQVKAVVEFMIQ
jgi:cytochrome c5